MLARSIAAILVALFAMACAGAPAAPTGTAAAPTAALPGSTPTAPGQPSAAANGATPTPYTDPYADDYSYLDTPPPATPTAAPAEGDFEITVADGGHLFGPANRALYTFDNDSPDQSACTGNCANTWPPLVVDASQTPNGGPGVDGELDVIERGDGSMQATYDGAPLYYYAGDGAPDDTNGDGVGGVWHLARP
jgi:predicted lipoprotein with Yx(FWY)xxD motif